MVSLIYYLRLGGRYALLSLLPTAVFYLLFVLLTRKKRPDRETKLRWGISCWYLCAILLGTLLGRWNSRHAPFTMGSLRLFGALRDVLVSTDGHARNLLIFNILVFVPLGLLLVWHAQGRGRRVFWAILLLPLAIELVQFATGLGFFELDDILLNSLGGALGLCLGLCYVNLKKRRSILLPALGLLLPLALIAAGLLWLGARPYGFVPQDFADPSHGKPQSVSVDALEGQLPESVTVYQIVSLSESEAAETAERLFGALGLSRNKGTSYLYDDVAVYYAEGSNEYAWVYFNGDFDLHIPKGLPVEGTAAETALGLLQRAGFALPAPDESAAERMSWRFRPAEGLLYNGEISAQVKAEGLTRIEARLRRLQPGAACAAYDAAALQKALREGRFSILEGPAGGAIDSLVCESAALSWVIDGKGCYHPVYALDCRLDGVSARILAPACG